MSPPFTTYGDHSTDYLSAQHPHPSASDDLKSSYNDYSDIIDQYADPYSRTSQHQTFAVSTHPIDDSDSRGPSYSLDQKREYAVHKFDEEHGETDSSNYDYPPIPIQKQEKIVDNRSFWAKVTATVSHIIHFFSNSTRFFQTPGHVDFLFLSS